MNEPTEIAAGAGSAPQVGIRARLSNFIRSAISGPYLPSPTDPRLFMLDVSHFNNIDMLEVAKYEVVCKAVMIRIGGSASVRDTKFQQYWSTAKQAWLPRSIYMYTWPGWSVDLHVRNFMNLVNEWTPGDLGEGPIWVDVETHANKSKREVSNHAFGVIESLKRETGKEIGWYSADWFLNGFMEVQDWMSDIWAWWAQWLLDQPREHPGPVQHHPIIPDEKLVIHQTGSNGDARIYNGTGRFDTDRWEASVELYNQLFNQSPESPQNDLAAQVASNTAAIAQILKGARIMGGEND